MVVTRSQLPHRSPTPLIVPCTCVAPASTAARAFATPHPESLCVWMPTSTSGNSRTVRATMAFNSVGSVPPLVSQRTSVVAPASAAARSTASEYAGIVAEAVEVVLGVEDDLFARVGQVRDGVAHGLEVLLRRGPQDLLDVQLPALGDDAGDGRGEGGEERDRGVVLRPFRSAAAPA